MRSETLCEGPPRRRGTDALTKRREAALESAPGLPTCPSGGPLLADLLARGWRFPFPPKQPFLSSGSGRHPLSLADRRSAATMYRAAASTLRHSLRRLPFSTSSAASTRPLAGAARFLATSSERWLPATRVHLVSSPPRSGGRARELLRAQALRSPTNQHLRGAGSPPWVCMYARFY